MRTPQAAALLGRARRNGAELGPQGRHPGPPNWAIAGASGSGATISTVSLKAAEQATAADALDHSRARMHPEWWRRHGGSGEVPPRLLAATGDAHCQFEYVFVMLRVPWRYTVRQAGR